MTIRDTNGETNGNGKSVTWKWLVGILFTLLLIAAGSVFAGFQNEQTRQATELRMLQKEKVDKEQYYRDLNGINAKLNTIDEYIRRR